MSNPLVPLREHGNRQSSPWQRKRKAAENQTRSNKRSSHDEFLRVVALSPDDAFHEFQKFDIGASWGDGIYFVLLLCAMFPNVYDVTSFMKIQSQYLYQYVQTVGSQWSQIMNAGLAIIKSHKTDICSKFLTNKDISRLPNFKKRAISDQESQFWQNFFIYQGIYFPSFKESLISWMFMKDTKVNTLWLYGLPNAGKSFLATQILYPFNGCIGVISNQGLLNEFALSHILDSSVLLWEEPFTDPSVAQDMKSVLGGKPIAVPMKYTCRQMLVRKPVLITSNYKDLTQGYNCIPVEMEALNARRYIFTLNHPTSFDFLVPDDSFWQWMMRDE